MLRWIAMAALAGLAAAPASAQSPLSEALKGTWTAFSGTEHSREGNATLTFGADGSGCGWEGGEYDRARYEVNGDRLSVEGDDYVLDFLDGNTLAVRDTDDGSILRVLIRQPDVRPCT